MKFLTSGLYMVRLTDPDKECHLHEAHTMLQSLQDHSGTLADHTSLLAWVKYILHHDDAEVLELLMKATTSDAAHVRITHRVNASVMLGLYYEKCAFASYRKAVAKTCNTGFKAEAALYRLHSMGYETH